MENSLRVFYVKRSWTRLPSEWVRYILKICAKLVSSFPKSVAGVYLGLVTLIVLFGGISCQFKPKLLNIEAAFIPNNARSSVIAERHHVDQRDILRHRRSVQSGDRPRLSILISGLQLKRWGDLEDLLLYSFKLCNYYAYNFSINFADKNITYSNLCPYKPFLSPCEEKICRVAKAFADNRAFLINSINLSRMDLISEEILKQLLLSQFPTINIKEILNHGVIMIEFNTVVHDEFPKQIAQKWCEGGLFELNNPILKSSKFIVNGFTKSYARLEEKKALQKLLPKFAAMFIIMVFVSCVISIKYSPFKYSRLSLALAAIAMSGIAVLCGFGMGLCLGVPLLVINAVIPFLILGIGLDSSFLIVHGALNILKSKSATSSQDFIIKTIDNCFMSVTMSDLTAILSFTVGSFTPFIAVNSVCRYLALSVACLWFAELFFFIPCLALKFQSHFKETNRERLEEMDANVFNVYEKYVNFLISFPASAGLKVQLFVKLFFILIFVGTLSFSIYSLIKMRKFADNLEAYNDNSIIKKFQKVALDSAAGYYFPTHLVFNKRLNLSDSSVLKQVQLAGNYISSSPLFTASETIEWLIELSNRTNISDINNYISNLKNNQFVDVKEIDNSYILMPRIYVTYRYNPLSGNIEEESKIIKAIFAFEDKFYDKIGSYFYDYKFSVMERDSLLVCSVWKSLLIAFACCIATVAIFIPNIWVLMTVVFLTASTTIMVLGLMAALGMTYSTSTYLMMLLAVGLCIDYIAHSGRFFFSVPRTHPNRCLLTQLDVGVPLFNAALSSFIGISALLFGNSPAIRNISKCLAIVFLVSFLNSVFVLPYLLTLRDTIKSLLKKYKPDSDA